MGKLGATIGWWGKRVAATGLAVLGLVSSPAAVSASTKIEVGMATGNTLLFISDSALEQRLHEMRNLGATMLRIDFNWSLIQKNGYNHFDYRYHDRVVNAAERHGMSIMALLTYTPAWARNPDCVARVSTEEGRQKCSPRDTNEFARFAKTMAQRYAAKGVNAWEIWNEPNHKGYWKWFNIHGELDLNPDTYGRLANTTAKAIHEADPDAVVVSGGLSPAYNPSDPLAMRQGDYLRRLLPELEPGGITAIGMHPYTWPALPREYFDWNAFYTVDHGTPTYNLRTILEEAGRGDLIIWATEFGATTVGVQGMVTEPADRKIQGRVYDHVSEDMQAQILRQGVEDWFAKENVGPLFIHADSDQWINTTGNEAGFGLRRKDGSQKPAYGTYLAGLETARQRVREE